MVVVLEQFFQVCKDGHASLASHWERSEVRVSRTSTNCMGIVDVAVVVVSTVGTHSEGPGGGGPPYHSHV